MKIDGGEPILRFVKGKYDQHGSTAILLAPADLNSILVANNIIGEGSLVKKILDGTERGMDNKIETLIYDTLSKYIIQNAKCILSQDLLPSNRPIA